MKSGRAKAVVGSSLIPTLYLRKAASLGGKNGCVMWAYKTFKILNWYPGSRELLDTNGLREQEGGTDVSVSVKEE